MTFRLTPRALNDLDQIDSWVLSKFGEAVAARVSREFLELFAILAIQPGLGRVRPDILDPSFRFYSYRQNWVIYKVGDPLLIYSLYPAAKGIDGFQF